MKKFDKYGFYRTLEPQNSFLQNAWKLDNSMEPYENELLIDVEILNINFVSFAQILEDTGGDKEKIAGRIIEIVNLRGKLHNPVTGTGGMLYGRVRKIGKSYRNDLGLKEGDEVISLVSLSTTPLKIEKIVSIDIGFAQVTIIGQAIVFQSSLIARKPEDLPLRVVISAWDEAGAPAETMRIVNPGDTVIILGAWGKMALLCAFAAREKMGNCGKITGVVSSEKGEAKLRASGVFDEILCCSVSNTLEFYNQYFEENRLFDVVINCSEEAYTEMVTLLLVRNKGIVYFASLRSDCKVASLTAESIGKDVTIIPYRGYVEGHTDRTLSLLRKYPALKELIEEGHQKGYAFLNSYKDTDREYIEASLNKLSEDSNSSYVFESQSMRAVLRNAIKVAKYDCTVMITGESGTGKEVVAQFIFNNSKRNNFPFVKINCASIPENLLESELFGYESGSFTGAHPKGKKGLWETAQGGVLFLDEIGEIPMSIQSKLLRVLQEKEIYRIGGTSPVKTDARIIVATNKDLGDMVKRGQFREDLYYRLNVFPIEIPPLRERRQDIIPLARLFLSEYNEKFNLSKSIDRDVISYLMEYDWPGNIRELQNCVQRLLITAEGDVVKLEDAHKMILFDRKDPDLKWWESPLSLPDSGTFCDFMDRMERELLRQYKAKYKTTRKMAKAMGITQSSVVRRLCRLGIH
ncbi:sigma 54-interacting transcriptional regulator [Sinanaerobacter chloroacetimidivorans]|uniref:HTH-type transcriptional regulatory protein TyrR n=1 Tax=Sinanaerobacter chloroacetimidivorans TaxID=2818044 RepID=A0A8J7VZX2_9FIRM|nr:sigma 54-interacting transcriptional regulator [Sinanaerobacter chloroacetimidivorans]MBR0598227.1 sigma 54-interacting transcriptional regulator [Sinanaerobacter chloroacetimidivorans]